MPKGNQAYSKLSAKERKALRDDTVRRVYLVTGIGEFIGNEAFLAHIKQEVIDRDKHGVTLRISGPCDSNTLRAVFKTGRLGPGGPLFVYLDPGEPIGPLIRKALGFDGDYAMNCIWEYVLENLALTNEPLRRFFKGSVATSKDCYLFPGNVVARIRRDDTDDGYTVEYVLLDGKPVCRVTSLTRFLSCYVVNNELPEPE